MDRDTSLPPFFSPQKRCGTPRVSAPEHRHPHRIPPEKGFGDSGAVAGFARHEHLRIPREARTTMA